MSKTAILLFANSASKEVCSKKFVASGNSINIKLSAILTQYFYNLALKVHSDVFMVGSDLQKGNTFGERISHAFEDIFDKGFENVICIGNDCPSLSAKHLAKAIEAVEKGQIGIGPSFDQGAYLIALPKSAFSYRGFRDIRWQSNHTFTDLNNYLQSQQNTTVTFENLADWDTPLGQFKALRPSFKLFKLIQNILLEGLLFRSSFSRSLYFRKLVCFSISRRGPPAISC